MCGGSRLEGKFSPRYIRSYGIVEKLNPRGYRLPVELEHVHNCFHGHSSISIFQTLIVIEPIEVAENLVYEERPMQILDYRVTQFIIRTPPLVKVI